MMRGPLLGFSTASLPNASLGDACRLGREMGFKAVELLGFEGARHSQGALAGFWFDLMGQQEREELRSLVSDFESVTIHAPFIALRLVTHNPGIKGESLRQVKVAMEACAYLGGTCATVHLNVRPFLTARDCWDEMLDVMRTLGAAGEELAVKVAFETGFPPLSEDFVSLIHDAEHPMVGANLDVGHVVAAVPHELRGTDEGAARLNEILGQMVRDLGDRLFEIHLHDVSPGEFRDHRRCGSGIIRFDRLLAFLAEARFEGPMVFELEDPDAEAALEESKRLIESCTPPP
jgi:sugar phosphate isomerase/epimerase